MTRAIITPDGVYIEDGTKTVILPSGVFSEDQAAAPAATKRLLLINPPGLDGGFGTGISL